MLNEIRQVVVSAPVTDLRQELFRVHFVHLTVSCDGPQRVHVLPVPRGIHLTEGMGLTNY